MYRTIVRGLTLTILVSEVYRRRGDLKEILDYVTEGAISAFDGIDRVIEGQRTNGTGEVIEA